MLRMAARGLIAAERLWRGLWPAQGFLAAYAALAFSGVLGDAHWVIRLIIALIAVAGVAWGLWSLARRYALPSQSDAEQRLEQDANLPHRPFQTLADTPSADTPEAEAAWSAHIARMAKAINRVRLGTPRIGLSSRDPWALRHASLLLLIGGLALGWGELGPRAVRAMQVWPVTAPVPSTVELWINPPEYTGAAPIRASATLDEIVAPIGSILKAVAETGKGAPTLTVDGAVIPFEALETLGAYAVETELTGGKAVTLTETDGAILAEWPLVVVPDAPPTASFVDDPAISQTGVIRFNYKLSDDYGIAHGKLGVTPNDGEPPGGYGASDVIPLPLPANVQKAAGALFRDLTAHRWAGRTVKLQIEVTDGIGQTGESKPLNFPLPERQFEHPVARAIISARKELDAEPRKREPIAANIAQLMRAPNAYDGSATVMTALGIARARLLVDRTERSYDLARELMWEIALRLEDGDLSAAERALRKARERLAEALARGASPEEIARLVEELKQAVERMVQALARAQQNNQAQPQQMDRNAQMMRGQDLMRMLDRIRELNEAGARDAAQEALAQVDRMLEQLSNARVMNQNMQRMQQMMQSMQEAQNLARQQQQLMDETMRQQQGQQGQPGQRGQQGQSGQQGQQGQSGQMGQGQRGRQGQMGQSGQGEQGQSQTGQGQRGQGQGQQGQGQGQNGQALAGQQESLRRALGEVMRQLGENGDIPGGLGAAERAMRDAVDGLSQGDQQGALGAQGEALQQLQEAARSMAEQLAQQLGQQQGQGGQAQGQNGQMNEGGTDPLGRATRGRSTGGVQIPDIGDLQRARTIQDELRRRAGDRARPPVERDYLERLLERF
jgi:uncharacterized protein (TIGR02302 family)